MWDQGSPVYFFFLKKDTLIKTCLSVSDNDPLERGKFIWKGKG